MNTVAANDGSEGAGQLFMESYEHGEARLIAASFAFD
jgi:hypothetical protein